jgi:hypothetical protein
METPEEKSERLWIEGQRILVQELELRNNFITENIRIMQLALENNALSLEHEKEQLNQYENR